MSPRNADANLRGRALDEAGAGTVFIAGLAALGIALVLGITGVSTVLAAHARADTAADFAAIAGANAILDGEADACPRAASAAARNGAALTECTRDGWDVTVSVRLSVTALGDAWAITATAKAGPEGAG